METYKDKFLKDPMHDPKTGKLIKIGSKRYKQLVEKYGVPKIKSPKTGYNISVGKGEYKNLLKQGYTDESLLVNKKIKSPITNKSIKIYGKEYNNLIKNGYFQYLTGNKDTDILLLLELDKNQLNNMSINKNLTNILSSDYFWCQWLKKHHGINVIKNCHYLANNMDFTIFDYENFLYALKTNKLPIIQYYIENDIISADGFDIETDFNIIIHIDPITIASRYNNIDIIQYLIQYDDVKKNDKSIVNSLYFAIEHSNVKMVKLLLPYINNVTKLNELLYEAINMNEYEIVNLIIIMGAEPESVIDQLIYDDNRNISMILNQYHVVLTIKNILNALAYKKYDILKILLLYDNPLPKEIVDKMLDFLKLKRYNNLENVMYPYIDDEYYNKKLR